MAVTRRGGRLLRVGAPVVATGLGLAAVGGALAPPAPADSVTERRQQLDRELDQLRESLEGTAKDLVDAAVDLKRSQTELVDARAELGGAERARSEAERRDEELASRLAVARAAEGKVLRDLETRRVEEERTHARLGRIARETYLTQGLSGLSVALEAASPEQFAARTVAADTAMRRQRSILRRLEVERAETRARRERLAAVRAEIQTLKRESEQVVVRRRAAEDAARSAEAQVVALVGRQQRAVSLIEARKAAEQRRVAALEAEERRITELLRARARARELARQRAGTTGGAAPRTTSGSGRLSYPVNAPVTSGFGMRYHPVLQYWRLHAGTDFGAACGTPVRSSAPGTVVRAGWAGGYGNQILVDHGELRGRDVATSYNHLSRIVVGAGRVERGQLIGYSGTTGLSTGCHLHYEVRVDGAPVNPMRWL